MKFLFVHQTCPGQHVHVVRYLRDAGHTIVFITQRRDQEIEGVRTLEYLPAPVLPSRHSYVTEMDGGVMNGLAVARLCEGLQHEGFTPDIVIGHTGWGELLFIKDIWPSVPLLGYFEFFYRPHGSDLDFDPAFPSTVDDVMRIRIRNATNLGCAKAWNQGIRASRGDTLLQSRSAGGSNGSRTAGTTIDATSAAGIGRSSFTVRSEDV